MRKLAFVTALLVLPLAGQVDAGAAPASQSIEELVKRHAELDMFSGTVLVAHHGKLLYSGAYGFANRDYGIPNRLNTSYNIGSIGKLFTATAIVQLAQTGKLKLDDPISKYLPECPLPEKTSITLQHLLNHSSGLADYMEHEDYARKMASIVSITDILPMIYSQKPQFSAGTQFAYSNSGMVLLGAIVEKVSGLSYPEYLQRHIFSPAGLTETKLAQEHDVLANRSIGYSIQPNGEYLANVRSVMPASADGGLRTTAPDLLRFDQAFNGAGLLNAESQKQMLTPVGPVPFVASGWFTQAVAGHRFVGHSGGAPGVSAEFRRYPEDGYTLIVLSNYDDGATPLATEIEKILFGLPHQVPTQVDADFARARYFDMSGNAAAALTLFDKLINTKQPHVPSLYVSARLRILSKTEPEKAVSALDRYIAIAGADANPSIGAAWWRKGNAYELLGKPGDAKKCYQRALELDPNDEQAQQSLAKLTDNS